MIVIHDNVDCLIKTTDDGLVIVLEKTTTQKEADKLNSDYAVPRKTRGPGRKSRKGVHLKKGIVDSNGEKKWVRTISKKTGGVQYQLNPKFNPSAEVEEEAPSTMAHLGQDRPGVTEAEIVG